MKYSEISSEALEPQIMWDNWMNYRDGMRDKTRYQVWDDYRACWIPADNKKIKKQIAIRKARKLKWSLLCSQSGMEKQKKN